MPGLTPEEQAFFESGGDTSKLNLPNIDPPAPPTSSAPDPLALSGLGNVDPPVVPAPVAPPTNPPQPPAPPPSLPPSDVNAEFLRKSLIEAQQQAANLNAQLEAAKRAQATPPVPAPDPNTDPLDSMLHQLDQVNKSVADLQSRLSEQQSQQQQVQAFQNFQKQVGALRDEFKLSTPDFDDAYKHLRETRMADLRAYGMAETDIAKQVFVDEVALAEAAIREGKNPAASIYEMAKRHGFTAGIKPPVTPPAPAPAAKLAAIKAGTASAPPNLPASPVADDISVDSLRQASDADLNKLVTDPNAWAKIAGGTNIPI